MCKIVTYLFNHYNKNKIVIPNDEEKFLGNSFIAFWLGILLIQSICFACYCLIIFLFRISFYLELYWGMGLIIFMTYYFSPFLIPAQWGLIKVIIKRLRT